MGIRKLVTALLFILTATTVFTGCGFRYVINDGTNFLDKKDAKEFNVEKSATEPITNVEIQTDFAKVELIPADNFYVEINYLYWEEEPEYSLKDGTLYFNDSDAFPNSYSINFNLNNTVKVYLPQDSKLDRLFVKDSSGDVSLAGFITDDLDVTVSYGDFTVEDAAATKADVTLSSGSSTFTNFQFDELNFTNSYGDADFTNLNTGEAKLSDTIGTLDISMSSGDVTILGLKSSSISISNSYGDITCEDITADEFDMDLSSGNLKVSNADLNKIDVHNSYGDVDLKLTGPADDYALDLDTSYGRITVGDEQYEEHLILENDGSREVCADLSSGDISLKFEN